MGEKVRSCDGWPRVCFFPLLRGAEGVRASSVVYAALSENEGSALGSFFGEACATLLLLRLPLGRRCDCRPLWLFSWTGWLALGWRCWPRGARGDAILWPVDM